MEQQQREERRNIEKDVGKILQKKEQMVKNLVERNKCVVMFGDIEKDQPVRNIREKGKLGRAKEVINKVNMKFSGRKWKI